MWTSINKNPNYKGYVHLRPYLMYTTMIQ